MALSYRWAEADDLPQISAFVERTYGADSVQSLPGRGRWLLADHPGGLHVNLCHDDGDLVAICGHQAFTLGMGATTVPAAYGLDFMVDPAYRRRGIGQQLLAMRLERFPLSISTGQSEAMAALYSRTGGRIIGRFYRAWYCGRPPVRVSLRAGLRGWLAWTRAASRRDVSGKRRPLALSAAVARLDAQEKLDRVRRYGPDEAGALATPAIWLWRYGGPVYRDHRCWELTSESGERGLLITRPDRSAEIIVDLICPPAVRACMLRLAGQTAPHRHCVVTACGRSLAVALKQAGYLVRPRADRVVALSRDADLLDALLHSDYLCWAGEADRDLLRRPESTPATL